jgi:hypothetical protein
MTTMRRPSVWMATVCLVLPVCAQAQGQDQSFLAGLDAREKQQWQQVATHMRRAIAADPQDSTRVVRSGFSALFRRGGSEYLPHFFLGEALFHLKDCPEAIREWSLSEQQGAVRGRTELLAIVQSGYAACAAQGTLPPGEFDPLVASIDQQIASAQAVSQRLSTAARARSESWQSGWRAEFDRAGAELKSAQVQLAAAIASRARQDFAAAAAAAGRATAALRKMQLALEAATSIAGALEGGARAYFAGDYQQVLAALADPAAAEANGRLRVHAHVFRAAAYYALFVRSGEVDDTLRRSAVTEIAACRQIDPAFAPDPQAFGPRFVSFFEAVVRAPAVGN